LPIAEFFSGECLEDGIGIVKYLAPAVHLDQLALHGSDAIACAFTPAPSLQAVERLPHHHAPLDRNRHGYPSGRL
jgi:hypothetical protein